MISGRIKEGCGAGAGSSLPASPRRPRPCRGVSWPGCAPGRVPPSFPPRPRARLPALAPHPPPHSGQRVPQASGLPGAGSSGGDPVQQRRGRLLPAKPKPEAGDRPGLCRAAASQPARSPGTARLAHQSLGTPAETRASELRLLIEIAGLGTAGGCLYRFDFCCSGKRITND